MSSYTCSLCPRSIQRSKRSDSAAGPRPGLVVRQDKLHCFTGPQDLAAKLLLTLATVAQRKAPLLSVADGKGAADALPWGVAGNSARRPTRFLLRQKVGQKGGPYDGGQRCALTARVGRN